MALLPTPDRQRIFAGQRFYLDVRETQGTNRALGFGSVQEKAQERGVEIEEAWGARGYGNGEPALLFVGVDLAEEDESPFLAVDHYRLEFVALQSVAIDPENPTGCQEASAVRTILVVVGAALIASGVVTYEAQILMESGEEFLDATEGQLAPALEGLALVLLFVVLGVAVAKSGRKAVV